MQTWILFKGRGGIKKTARRLDKKRLGAQKNEANLLIKLIEQLTKRKNHGYVGYLSHPATKQWLNHYEGLKYYFNCMLEEWKRRGCNTELEKLPVEEQFELPPFVENEKFITWHRQNLVEKDKEKGSEFYEEWKELGGKSSSIWYIKSDSDGEHYMEKDKRNKIEHIF
jgi:hypothetical protein